ncbi:antitoxin [Pseudonocardia nematodicida]|uniref:Antitoxin n=1 Tax=Pseudonocardia nematodicida TaxID=1206997 RepID=A0ABV1KBD0_9PSEU
MDADEEGEKAMGFLDKAREAAESALEKAAPHLEKAKEKAGPHLDKAKEKAGPLVEKAATQVDKATGGKYSEQIDGVKGKVEGALGHSAPDAPGAGTHTAPGDVPPVPPAPPGGDALKPDGNPARTPKNDDDGGVPPVPPAR